MGMKIKEAREIISRPLYMKNVPQEIIDAHKVAIESMRKYHQIVQIYQKWNEVNDFTYNQAMRKICEVIEDE